MAEGRGTSWGDGSDATLVIERSFDAPRDLVFKAFSEPERFRAWFGGPGTAIERCEMDCRTGGACHYSMKGPDGSVMWGKFDYLEVDPPSRIVYVNYFSDEAGGITRNPYSASWPHRIHNTLTFREEHGQTVLMQQSRPLEASEEEIGTFLENTENVRNGMGVAYDRLADYLAMK